MKDDLTGIFDHLNPEDFDRSSVRYMAEAAFPGWTEWVEENLRASHIAWLAADGLMNPITIMRTRDDKVLMFSPDDDETLGQYVERLEREAHKHRAVRFYTTVLTQGGRYEDDSPGAVGDPDKVLEAAQQGAMKPCLFFYAQQKNVPGQPDAVRHGIITIEDGDLSNVFDAPPEHAPALYAKVLP